MHRNLYSHLCAGLVCVSVLLAGEHVPDVLPRHHGGRHHDGEEVSHVRTRQRSLGHWAVQVTTTSITTYTAQHYLPPPHTTTLYNL